VREGTFSPELFARYQRSEQALILTLMEMVVNGVCTRKVARITEELCGHEFAKSTVSDLCKGLDPLVEAWNGRELGGMRYPFVRWTRSCLALPAAYRKRLRTTNGVERLNEEIPRRERVIRLFPNRESAQRLLGALLMEQDEAWSTGKRYFDMTAYWQWRTAPSGTTEGGSTHP
jgi:transposase-like protein